MTDRHHHHEIPMLGGLDDDRAQGGDRAVCAQWRAPWGDRIARVRRRQPYRHAWRWCARFIALPLTIIGGLLAADLIGHAVGAVTPSPAAAALALPTARTAADPAPPARYGRATLIAGMGLFSLVVPSPSPSPSRADAAPCPPS